MINVQYDEYATESDWILERRLPVADSLLGSWATLALQDGLSSYSETLVSFEANLATSSTYRFTMTDSANDGICCDYGNGWIALTRYNTVGNNALWTTSGADYSARIEVIMTTSSSGFVQLESTVADANP